MNEPWLTEGPYTREVLGKDHPVYFLASPDEGNTFRKTVLLWLVTAAVGVGIFVAACAWARAQARGVTVIVTPDDRPLHGQTDTTGAIQSQP